VQAVGFWPLAILVVLERLSPHEVALVGRIPAAPRASRLASRRMRGVTCCSRNIRLSSAAGPTATPGVRPDRRGGPGGADRESALPSTYKGGTSPRLFEDGGEA